MTHMEATGTCVTEMGACRGEKSEPWDSRGQTILQVDVSFP
jgi:hypothetical protein